MKVIKNMGVRRCILQKTAWVMSKILRRIITVIIGSFNSTKKIIVLLL